MGAALQVRCLVAIAVLAGAAGWLVGPAPGAQASIASAAVTPASIAAAAMQPAPLVTDSGAARHSKRGLAEPPRVHLR